MSTEELKVLVLATGATINLEVTTNATEQEEPELLELEIVGKVSSLAGCDPLNTADRLLPDARMFRQTIRREKNKVPIAKGGLPDATLKWLEDFFHSGVLSNA